MKGVEIMKPEVLEFRKKRLQELLEINDTYQIQDRRLLHLLKLLDEHQTVIGKANVVKSYVDLKNMIEKYGLSEEERITEENMTFCKFAKEHHMTKEQLEQRFQKELGISPHAYVTDKNIQEKWGLTTVPLSKELMEKYNRNDEEVRTTYRIFTNHQWREVYDPVILEFLTFVDQEENLTHIHQDYEKMKQIFTKYQISESPKFDIIDFYSHEAGYCSREELNAYFIAETDHSIDEFMANYYHKNMFEEVSRWGLKHGKDGLQDTYEFTPMGNPESTTLVDFVDSIRSQKKDVKPQVTTIQELDISNYPKEITNWFANIPTFERTVNELLEVQSYGLSYEEMKYYIYQKFIAHNYALLGTENYLDLARKEIWALIFIHQVQTGAFYQVDTLEQEEDRISPREKVRTISSPSVNPLS